MIQQYRLLSLCACFMSMCFDPTCVEAEITKELEKVNFLMKLSKLSLNTQKTKLMIFHRKQKKVREIDFSMDNNPIEQVSVFNFLGIILDENLSWKTTLKRLPIKFPE